MTWRTKLGPSPGPPTGVFISYRRDDASGFAGRLHAALTGHFGAERVFRDIDSIAAGADFGDVISESLNSCGVVVAIIGQEWVTDRIGRRRLDDPKDWVRIELEEALSRSDVLILPVLVEQATMPAPADLPQSLAPFTRRNAIEVSDARWEYDVARLAQRIEAKVGPPRVRWKTTVRRWVTPTGVPGALVRVGLAVAVVLGLVQVLGALMRGPAVAPMTGDFNVAVAEFETVDHQGDATDSDEGPVLAESVYQLLEAELESQGGGFQVRGPSETSRIRGGTRAERADAAARVARQLQADVIVYGTLRTDVPNRFEADFYVSDRLLQHADEFFGQHSLGSTIETVGEVRRNVVILNALREQILGRARALVEFIVGLSHYGANEPQEAFNHFDAARSLAGWEDAEGREVLYLFLGNTSGRLGDLDGAERFYDRALTLSPQYARAMVGRAEVLFHRARGDCQAGNIDVNGVQRSLATYEEAVGAQVQPALSDVPTKVAFGRGRAYLCLSQAAAGDHFDEAEQEFEQVVDEFRRGNRRVRELAAESYGGLAFVHLPAVGVPDTDRYHRAAAEYQDALDLSLNAERKAYFSSMRGFIFSRLGDTEKALQAYDLAIRLSQNPEDKADYEEARAALLPS